MKFGTIAFNGEIYNLDYMNSEEIKEIINKIEKSKDNSLYEAEFKNEK